MLNAKVSQLQRERTANVRPCNIRLLQFDIPKIDWNEVSLGGSEVTQSENCLSNIT
jgi:hypothetical protein